MTDLVRLSVFGWFASITPARPGAGTATRRAIIESLHDRTSGATDYAGARDPAGGGRQKLRQRRYARLRRRCRSGRPRPPADRAWKRPGAHPSVQVVIAVPGAAAAGLGLAARGDAVLAGWSAGSALARAEGREGAAYLGHCPAPFIERQG